MRHRISPHLRRLAEECRGAEIAETAAVLPIVFMMLLGVFWFGQAFSIYGTITHAARLGARAGAAPSCTTCAAGNTVSQNAYAAVQSALMAAKLDPTKAQWPAVQPSLNSCLDGSAKPCNASPTNVCVQESVQFSNTGAGAAGVCGVSVSFQYPYQFWLPFTSLNMQRIQLQAVGRVRMETR
jgi:Flp pilus assembly protein TadG